MQSFIQGKKYLLQMPEINLEAVYSIASEHNISIPISKVLYNRGFRSSDQIKTYLFSSSSQISRPELMLGCEIAVERILSAISNQEKILIAGDYDVDGVTSSALILATLLPLGAKINYFLPNRENDGYGLSRKTVTRAAKSGYKLIVTVDNGISAIDAANAAEELGIDLIITDHHRPQQILPKALSIIDPNQDDCKYPFKGLTGVGVIFKIISLIYERKGLALPDKAYELLLMGTIADVAPLLDENRFWVRYGLSKINKKKSYAIKILMQNSKLSKDTISSLDIGFFIAPQINALGRLSDSRDAVKFLISSSRQDVESIGKILLEMNDARKRIEKEIYKEIAQKIDLGIIDLNKESLIVAIGKTWPSGVVGLVAGKLMHNYSRPTIIFHELADGTLKGSCRSIPSFNIFNALSLNKELLLSFGGHSFAAGLSLRKENLDTLKERLLSKISTELTEFDLIPKLKIDAELELSEMNSSLISGLENLAPFGHQNEQPLFYLKNVVLLRKPQLIKDQHTRCFLFSDGIIKPAIFFNRPDIYKILENIGDNPFSVVGYVNLNEWEGKASVQFQGLDIV